MKIEIPEKLIIFSNTVTNFFGLVLGGLIIAVSISCLSVDVTGIEINLYGRMMYIFGILSAMFAVAFLQMSYYVAKNVRESQTNQGE